ncbi:MAG: hypothetical protein ABI175_09855, partial [Polyangiales bacterium]
MDRNNIESGKDDNDLSIGHAHGVAQDDDEVIQLEDEDILAEEYEEDAGDLDFEPDYDRDY